MIKGLLEQHGIEAHVAGHYLQGAMGELPAINLIQINVSAEDEALALKVIEDYDAGRFEIHDENVD